MWPLKVEHEVKLNRIEMIMIRWICGLHKKKEKCRVGLETVRLVVKRGRLTWFGHVVNVEHKDVVGRRPSRALYDDRGRLH